MDREADVNQIGPTGESWTLKWIGIVHLLSVYVFGMCIQFIRIILLDSTITTSISKLYVRSKYHNYSLKFLLHLENSTIGDYMTSQPM